MDISFEKDEALDKDFLNELLEKEKNHLKVADELSKRFTKKYGLEFGGFVKLEVNLVDNSFKLLLGKDQTINIDKDELEEIPAIIRKQRELRKAMPKKIDPKKVGVQDILNNKV